MSEAAQLPPRRPRSPLARVLLAPVDVVVAVFVLLDTVFGPLLGPVLRWVARLRLVAAAERAIASLPAYAILVLLAVPFAIAEPLKIVALWWIASGRVALGVAALVFAYVVSLVIVERMYHAGREKLLTIRWFARIMGWLVGVRDAVLDRLRETALWRSAADLGRSIRRSAAGLRIAVAALFARLVRVRTRP